MSTMGSNAGGAYRGLNMQGFDRDDDMAAFDKLGPRARFALNYANATLAAIPNLAALTARNLQPESQLGDALVYASVVHAAGLGVLPCQEASQSTDLSVREQRRVERAWLRLRRRAPRKRRVRAMMRRPQSETGTAVDHQPSVSHQ